MSFNFKKQAHITISLSFVLWLNFFLSSCGIADSVSVATSSSSQTEQSSDSSQPDTLQVSSSSLTSQDPSDIYAQLRQDCVDKINDYRATEGKDPLERWTAQEECTDGEAESDYNSGTAHGSFETCGEMAQNECPGYRSLSSIVDGCLDQMWEEGPGEPYSEHGHYLNMSSTQYSKVACGFYEGDDGKVWAIQNFQ